MNADIGQLIFIDEKLRNLALWLEASTGQEYTITSLFRLGDKGPHGTLPLRAIDLRCRNEKIGLQIVEFINAHWRYDYLRPGMMCAILHGEASNMHIHLQVHKNTQKE